MSEPPIDAPPELDLLLRRLRVDPQPEEILALAGAGIDWSRLCRLAREHGVLPALFVALERDAPRHVPAKTIGRLRELFHANVASNLLLTGELFRVLDIFSTGGVEAVPFKGPVLARLAYAHPETRQLGDLDFLVRKADVLRARALLTAAGFAAYPQVTPAQERAFLKSECELWLNDPRDLVSVEIHWAIREPAYCFPFEPERLWSGVRQMELRDRNVPTFRAEDLLLILAAHGAKHRWDSLKLVCDVAELVRAHPALDWDNVLQHAGALHAERVLRVALRLAGDCLGAPVPETVRQWSSRDSAVPALVGDLRAQWGSPVAARMNKRQSLRLYLRMRERLRDRARYYFGTALTPTLEDWTSAPLPDALYPLYWAVRPIRLVTKRATTMLRPGRAPEAK